MSLLKRILWYLRYRVALLFARKNSLERIKKAHKKNLLVLCYGNIYRSPFVENYLKITLAHEGMDLSIKSSGFHQKSGRVSPADYQKLVLQFGVDLSSHKSSTVDKALIKWADYILIMEGMQYKMTLVMDATARQKLIWLGAFEKANPVEIPDPYSQNQTEVLKVVERMKSCCDNLVVYFKNT